MKIRSLFAALVLTFSAATSFAPVADATYEGQNGNVFYIGPTQKTINSVSSNGEVSTILSADETITSFSISPDSSKLVYAYTLHDSPLYLYDVVTKKSIPISDQSGETDFSFDGRYVANALYRTSTNHLEIIDLLTGKIHLITQGNASSPIWSPKEHVLAYVANPQDKTINFLDINAGEIYEVATIFDYSPLILDWSPDGSKLAMLGVENGNFQNNILNLTSGQYTKTDPTNKYSSGIITEMRWSPDGTKMAWYHDTPSGYDELIELSGETSDAPTKILTQAISWQSAIAWQALNTGQTTPTPPTTTPVYRFWSDSKQKHFYTADAEEKKAVIAKWSRTWAYEGVAYNVPAICDYSDIPVYRFWSDSKQGHFYTSSLVERNAVIRKWSNIWAYEGPVFCTVDPADNPTAKPVYRFWSDSKQAHFYTASLAEKNQIISKWPHIWSYEGIAYHVR